MQAGLDQLDQALRGLGVTVEVLCGPGHLVRELGRAAAAPTLHPDQDEAESSGEDEQHHHRGNEN
jgi:hypothetical protein